MIRLLRSLRLKLVAENKGMAYLRYAFGEIVLVMIGILLALQVNTWNIDRIKRNTELKYLNNIKVDLSKDIESLDFNIEYRETAARSSIGRLKMLSSFCGICNQNP